MKLGDHILTRSVSLDDAAIGIGDVSVSGLRKWISGERTPRPDQMRRIFDWSEGAVTPNDFILGTAPGSSATMVSHAREDAASATSRHVNSAPASSHEIAR